MDLLQKLDEALRRAEERVKQYAETRGNQCNILKMKSLNYARSARQKSPRIPKRASTVLPDQQNLDDSKVSVLNQQSNGTNANSPVQSNSLTSGTNTTSSASIADIFKTLGIPISPLSRSSSCLLNNKEGQKQETPQDIISKPDADTVIEIKSNETPISSSDTTEDRSSAATHTSIVGKRLSAPVETIMNSCIRKPVDVSETKDVEKLLAEKRGIYSSIENKAIKQELESLDEHILKLFNSIRQNNGIPCLKDVIEIQNDKAAKIIEKYLGDEGLPKKRDEIKSKIISLARNNDFIHDLVDLVPPAKENNTQGEFSNEMLEKIISVLNKGDIQSDKRFIGILDKTIATLTKSKDPFTCKVTVNIAICRKYVEDFIELKGIVEGFMKLKL